MNRVFYRFPKLTVSEKKDFLRRCKSKSILYWVDELDCSKSWARKKIDMPFEDSLKLIDSKTHFVLTRDYFDCVYDIEQYGCDSAALAGFRTMSLSVDYFLWVYFPIEFLQELVTQYSLEVM